jgi:DNA-directed RNA polymerase specialized sigma24 family protein
LTHDLLVIFRFRQAGANWRETTVNDVPSSAPGRGREARLSLVSFETFFKRYFPALLRYLISQANDTSWAEDVAQETMIAASDKWDDLLTYDRPDSWLFKVATRKLRRLEARAREHTCLPDDTTNSRSDLTIAAASDEWVSEDIDVIASARCRAAMAKSSACITCGPSE